MNNEVNKMNSKDTSTNVTNVEKKKAPLWQTLLLIGGVCGYGGYEIYHQVIGSGAINSEDVADVEFVSPFPKGTEVIVYTYKSDTKPVIESTTVLSDFVEFYQAVVVKPMGFKNDTLELEVTSISEGNKSFASNVGDLIKNVDQSIVYPAKFETKEIQNLYSKLQYLVFSIVNKEISVKLSNLSDLHINLADISLSIDREVRKFKNGDFLDSEVLKMMKIKKLLEKSYRYLGEIYDLNKHYHVHYGMSVVDIERICDIELFFQNIAFQDENHPQLRLLNYFAFLESSGDEMAKLMNDVSRMNVSYGCDDIFAFYKNDEAMDAQFKVYLSRKFKTLSSIVKRNSMIREVEGISNEMKMVSAKLEKVKKARQIIDNFATYLIYFHPKVSASSSLTDMMRKSKPITQDKQDSAKDSIDERSVFAFSDSGELVEVKNQAEETQFMKNMSSSYDLGIPEEELVIYKTEQEKKMKEIKKEEEEFEMRIGRLAEKRVQKMKECVELIEGNINSNHLGYGCYQLDKALTLYYQGNIEEGHALVRRIAVDNLAPLTSGHAIFAHMKEKGYDDTLYYYYRLAISHLDKDTSKNTLAYQWNDLSVHEPKILTTEVESTNHENFKAFVHDFYKIMLLNVEALHEMSITDAMAICLENDVEFTLYDGNTGIPYENVNQFLELENGILKLKTGPVQRISGVDLFADEKISSAKFEFVRWMNVLTDPMNKNKPDDEQGQGT